MADPKQAAVQAALVQLEALKEAIAVLERARDDVLERAKEADNAPEA